VILIECIIIVYDLKHKLRNAVLSCHVSGSILYVVLPRRVRGRIQFAIRPGHISERINYTIGSCHVRGSLNNVISQLMHPLILHGIVT
jgi:hypothetical protein